MKKLNLKGLAIIFLFLFCLLTPTRSEAAALVPYFDVSVTKNVLDGDGVFDFNYIVHSSGSLSDSADFNIETVGGSGSYFMERALGSGSRVELTEKSLSGWQFDSVSCTSTNPNITFEQISNGVLIHAEPYSAISCVFNNSKKSAVNPVIIIPGILGSAEKNKQWVIDPILHVYDNLIDTLKANGYEEGKTLFTLPYDWHNSNMVTETLLRSKIDEVENICGCNRVDIIAHSMGGLVARYYVQSPLYKHDVDKLIFLGTPHLGAPKVYLTWEAGEGAGDTADWALKSFFSKEAKKAGYGNIFDYIRNNVPSIEQLLPVYDYIKIKSSGEIIKYPEDYPRNYFLENLNNNVSALLNSGVSLYDFVGNTGTSTIDLIRVASSTDSVLWADGMPDGFYDKNSTDNGLERGLGDGTVPINSASFINSNLTKINYAHTDLPTGTEGQIYKILTGKDADSLVLKSHIPNFILIIKILSPADIQVVAPDGKVIGKDFNTATEMNEIPGAFYSGFNNDDEYVTIPDPLPGEYIVKTIGTGSGAYTVSSSLISNEKLDNVDVVGTTKPGFEADVSVNISNGNELKVSTPDAQAITPDSVIADVEQSYMVGLIKKKNIKDFLVRQIEKMVKIETKINKIKSKPKDDGRLSKKVDQFTVKVDKVLAKALEKELKLYLKGGLIDQQAYDLIKNDLELLMLIY